MAGSWYVNSSRVAVNWATAVVSGKATLDIYRISVVADGYTALKLSGYLPGYYAELVGLPRRDYAPGETVIVTTGDALRLINAGSYVAVNPSDDAAVALVLAQGVYATALWAGNGATVAADTLAAAKADTSTDSVPAVPVAPAPLPSGGTVDAGALIDLSSRMDRLEQSLAANSTTDRARGNHTGTQLANTVSDLREAVQDVLADTLKLGTGSTGASLVYDDAAGTLTLTVTGVAGAGADEIGTDTDGVPYLLP